MNLAYVRPLVIFSCLIGILCALPTAEAQYRPSILELTGADTSASLADGANWGWWSESKYDTWSTTDDGGFDLEEIRLTMPSDSYGFILAWDTYPTLSANGSWVDTDTGATVNQTLVSDFETYDLAFSYPYRIGSYSVLSPILGATLMKIEERRLTTGAELPADKATTRLWGIVAGIEGMTPIADRLELTGRFLARWGSGDRDARYTPEDDPSTGQVSLSDSTDRIMYGAELGLRYSINEAFKAEAGYRYRDWTWDDGPATFDGYYVRLVLIL